MKFKTGTSKKTLWQELEELIIEIENITIYNLRLNSKGYYIKISGKIYSLVDSKKNLDVLVSAGQEIDLYVPNKMDIKNGRKKITLKNRTFGLAISTKLNIKSALNTDDLPSIKLESFDLPKQCKNCGGKIIGEDQKICEICGSEVY